MKKVFLSVILAVLAGISSVHAVHPSNPDENGSDTKITSLVINVSATIVLVDDSKPVRVGGNEKFLSNVTFKQVGNKLVIDALKDRDFKNKGVIYVPASQLKYIEINSSANVSTESALSVPVLDVMINGECNILIANKGKCNIKDSQDFEAQYEVETRRFPVRPLFAVH
jgi:hypothetical protein